MGKIILNGVDYSAANNSSDALSLSGGSMYKDASIHLNSDTGIGTSIDMQGGGFASYYKPSEINLIETRPEETYMYQNTNTIQSGKISLYIKNDNPDDDNFNEKLEIVNNGDIYKDFGIYSYQYYGTNCENSITFRNGLHINGGGAININSNGDDICLKTPYAIYFNSSGEAILDYDGFYPKRTNELDLGDSAHKWSNIYATNGTIQTSDRTRKTDINNLETQKAQAFINGLTPVSYKMIDGTSGRIHYGFIAQDIEELMNALNMDSKDFAGFIKSPKKITKYEDENGNKLKKPIEEVVEGEYDYSLRYDEFIAPLIKVVQEQQKEIERLKEMIAI